MRAIVKVVFLLSALVVVTLRDGFAESHEKVQILQVATHDVQKSVRFAGLSSGPPKMA